MRIIKILLIPLILITLIFIFLLSSEAFVAWTYEDDVYLFQIDSQRELIERIDTFYNKNENFWYGDRIFDFISGHEEYGQLEYQLVDVKLDNMPAIIKIKLLKDSEKPSLHVISYLIIENQEKTNSALHFKSFNRLQLDKDEECIRKEFESQFLDELKIYYMREEYSKVNKWFSDWYLRLHPKYRKL